VELPWRIGDDGHVYALHPVLPRVSPGDWASIEEWLGVKLPGDYKEVIGDGPSLVFDDELLISSPFCEMAPLGRRVAWGSWSLACLRQRFPEEFDVALFPEPSGLLCWGTDGGGGDYYWDTTAPDPALWTVVVSGRSVDDGGIGETHDCGLTGYLSGLARGRIEAGALGGWPGPNPQLRRVSG